MCTDPVPWAPGVAEEEEAEEEPPFPFDTIEQFRELANRVQGLSVDHVALHIQGHRA